MVQIIRPSGFGESYGYDVLGQRIGHSNSFYGAAVVEATDYDAEGRVIRTTNFAGDITTHSYTPDAGW